MLREGRKAVEGLVAAHDSLASWGGEVRLTLLGEFEASSGDLACEYGSWVPAGKASRVSGSYLHVWKRAPDGNWKLAVDYIQRNPRAAH